MVETVTKLGPLGLPQKFAQWDEEMEHFAAHVAAQEAGADGGCPEHGTNPQPLETAHA